MSEPTPLHITTTEDVQRSKKGGKDAAMALSVLFGVAAFVVSGIFSLCGVGDFTAVLCWTAGTSVFMWGLARFGFRTEGDDDKASAQSRIGAAVAGLADNNFTPTQEQYDKLIMDGEAIPFTVGGVSGAKIIRGKSFSESPDSDGQKVHKDIYSFDIEPVDDGVANFKRVLEQAINSNEDISRAASKSTIKAMKNF